MPDSKETHLEESCEICGDIGVLDAIITCSQCKITREHVYCRKNYSEDTPNVCETCEMESKISPKSLKEDLPKTKLSGSMDQENKCSAGCSKLPKWEKMVKTGKVKYMPAQEAIMLSSGAKKFQSPSKSNMHSSSGQAEIVRSLSLRTPIKPKAIPPKSPLNVKASPSFRPSGLLPSRNRKTETNSVIQQQVTQTSKDPKGGNDCATEESRNFDAEKCSPMDIPPKAEKCLQVPALHSYWKGSFEILDTINHKELNDGFRAHPPSKVLRKVYDFSKKLPEILQFKLLPRNSFWTDIFQDDCPNEDDIGLYFFSSNSQRSANYIFLLEFMETQELAMRCYINGVELLVFTSKLLSAKSQRWNGEYFLWGVFRRVKKDKASCKLNEELPFSVQSSDCAQDNDANGDDSVVDMEIDMLAGEDVGRVDIANSRESSTRSCGNSREEITEIHSISRNLDFTLQQPLPEVKKELWTDIPPGFEEIYSPKVQNNACSADTARVEKPLLLDGTAISPAEKGACLERVSEVSGTSRLQPKPVEDSDSPRLQGKHRQVPTAAYTSPPLVKRNAFCLAEKVGGPDDERCVKTEKKESVCTPVSKDDCSKSSLCSKLKATPEDYSGYLQRFFVKVKTEVPK